MSISRQLYNVGEDTFKNYFKLQIVSPEKISAKWEEEFSIRVNDVAVPAQTSQLYEVPFLTHKILKKKSTITNPSEFTFNIRVDKEWKVYQAFLEWKKNTENNTTGKLGEDTATTNFRTDILITPIQKSVTSGIDQNAGSFTFKQCLIKEVGGVGFDYASNDPVSVQITILFLDFIPTVGLNL